MSYLNGEASHWLTQSPPETTSPSPLPTAKQDLIIVGGGMTGLWSAYYARQAHPDWQITIVEAKHIGYGASRPQRRLALDIAAGQQSQIRRGGRPCPHC